MHYLLDGGWAKCTVWEHCFSRKFHCKVATFCLGCIFNTFHSISFLICGTCSTFVRASLDTYFIHTYTLQRLTRVNDDGYISFALKWRPCQCHGQCIPRRPFFLLRVCLSRSTKEQAFSSNTLYWRCIIATARSEPLYVTDFGQSA